MSRAQEIAAQIGSLNELSEIVTAIREMAAVQMRQSQSSLDAVRDYIEIIRRALGEAVALCHGGDGDSWGKVKSLPGLVVFGAEHGFCGAFNEPLIRTAIDASRGQPSPYLIFVGTRGAQRSSEHDLRPNLTLPMATHSGGVGATARRIAAEIYRMFVERTLTSVEVLYMRTVAGRESGPQRLRLLPLEPAPVPRNGSAMPPLVNMAPRRLRDELAAEYMFAMLEAIAMESFASENAARFRTMEAAHENIDTKRSQLGKMAHRMRQEAVTAEILEIIGGAEAMKRTDPFGARR